MAICKNCGTSFNGKFCPTCGTVAETETFCPSCGTKNDGGATFCKGCGASLNAPVNNAYAQPVYVQQAQPVNTGSNGCAIAGFVLSLLGITLLGFILSIVGIAKAKDYGGRGKGLGIAGLIISILWVVILVVMILVVLPGMLESIPSIPDYYY